jgi:hypothetical protein
VVGREHKDRASFQGQGVFMGVCSRRDAKKAGAGSGVGVV